MVVSLLRERERERSVRFQVSSDEQRLELWSETGAAPGCSTKVSFGMVTTFSTTEIEGEREMGRERQSESKEERERARGEREREGENGVSLTEKLMNRKRLVFQ